MLAWQADDSQARANLRDDASSRRKRVGVLSVKCCIPTSSQPSPHSPRSATSPSTPPPVMVKATLAVSLPAWTKVLHKGQSTDSLLKRLKVGPQRERGWMPCTHTFPSSYRTCRTR